MPTGTDDVRLRRKTGSHGQTVKMTRMTHLGHWAIGHRLIFLLNSYLISRPRCVLSEERVERRLAAILAADIAGYSRLMGANEEGTLAQLKSIRKALVDPAIAAHRGHIIFYDNDIFGDGVNIAARLEGIAEPGGVCMSDDAYRQVRGKVEIACDDMGQQSLRNIAEPMRAWRVRLTGQAPSAVKSGLAMSQPQVLPPPDKPSIAVLPFQNMSGDPEQEYFADGMSEDIITALSRFKALFVIARNSSFTYKGRAVDVKQVG